MRSLDGTYNLKMTSSFVSVYIKLFIKLIPITPVNGAVILFIETVFVLFWSPRSDINVRARYISQSVADAVKMKATKIMKTSHKLRWKYFDIERTLGTNRSPIFSQTLFYSALPSHYKSVQTIFVLCIKYRRQWTLVRISSHELPERNAKEFLWYLLN